ncbi:MAG: hypothetical protein ABSH20_00390, partial [Tepidisphaeraceae bacterium]
DPQTLDVLLGGQNSVEFGHGMWLEMVRGKYVLPMVVDKCFRVPDAKGRQLQGEARLMEVVKDLLRLPLNEQPPDFQTLHRLISLHIQDN